MKILDNSYVEVDGIYYDGVLRKDVKKHKNQLRPIYEAFTNAFEAIESLGNPKDHTISISIFKEKNLIDENVEQVVKITISDSGVGFNDENFNRLMRYKDDRKGPSNRGSGRLQYVHFFKETRFDSLYIDNGVLNKRRFKMSKTSNYMQRNTIIYYEGTEKIIDGNLKIGSNVTFVGFLDKKDKQFYNSISIKKLKSELVSHYLLQFCLRLDGLPNVFIKEYVDGRLKEQESIDRADLPTVDKSEEFEVSYVRPSKDFDTIIKTNNHEKFTLSCFKIDCEILKENGIKLTSKGEIAQNIDFNLLSSSIKIDNFRYLFLLSGEYLDINDGDLRGHVEISTQKQFLDEVKSEHGELSIFSYEERVVLDDLISETNENIKTIYPEINEKVEDHNNNIEQLKLLFLLSDEHIRKAKIAPNDSDQKILEKIYQTDMKVSAKQDAQIKAKIDYLEELSPKSKEYKKELIKYVDEFTRSIPLYNRTQLTRYVARRKLVLDLFEKSLEIRSNSNNKDEELLHNIIFQQKSDKPEDSDMWILNEEYIYFNGASDCSLGDIKYSEESIFKEALSQEELEYRKKQSGDANMRRPDILLFPAEGKCIIIEFKDPKEDISKYLGQINRYASLILNLSKDKFSFNTFYGYLIGEEIDYDSVRDVDSDFKASEHFNYMFRPHKAVAGKFKRTDGALYTEILKYSTLLKRAKVRNKIFIDKLLSPNKVESELVGEISDE